MLQREIAPGITLEHALWVGGLLLATALRVYDLGAQPLSREESAQALSAWQLAQGNMPQAWDVPLVGGVVGALFFLLGSNDFTARLAPAMMGVVLVGLVWPLRCWLGRGGALTAAYLLALSPTMVYTSRRLSPEVFAAALLLLAAFCWLRYHEERRGRFLLGGSVTLALLLNASAMGTSAVLLLVASFAMLYASGVVGHIGAVKAKPGGTTAIAGALFLAAYIGVGSGLFTYSQGLEIPSLKLWIAQMKTSATDQPWYHLWVVLAAYEPLALGFGALGAGHYLRRVFRGFSPERADKFGMFLVFWAAASLLFLTILGDKPPHQSLLATVPLTILAGGFIANNMARFHWERFWRATPLMGVAVVATVFAVLVAGGLSQGSGYMPSYLWPLVGAGVLLAAVAMISVWRRHGSLPVVALACGLAVVFVVHTTWRLNFTVGSPETFAPEVVHRQGIDAALSPSSPFPVEYPAAMVVETSLREPLAWYLRQRDNVSYVPRAFPGAPIIIAPADGESQRRLAGYSPRQYWLSSTWSPQVLDPVGWWRWLMYGEARGGWGHTAFAIYRPSKE